MPDQYDLDSDAMALGFRDHTHRLSARRLRMAAPDDDDEAEERLRMDRQAHEDSQLEDQLYGREHE